MALDKPFRMCYTLPENLNHERTQKSSSVDGHNVGALQLIGRYRGILSRRQAQC